MFIIEFYLNFLNLSNLTNLFIRCLFNLADYISDYTAASDWMNDEE